MDPIKTIDPFGTKFFSPTIYNKGGGINTQGTKVRGSFFPMLTFGTAPMLIDSLTNDGIMKTEEAQNTLSANPILASELNAARNLGVPQDNRFTGIMRNTFARPLMFQAGANVGLTAGNLLGVTNPLLALAGAIGSQFLPLGRSKPGMDYQYVNQPGGVNVVDNKITTGVLAGKNFESAFGSRDLGEMYQNYIDQFEDEEDLSDFQKSQ